MPAEWALPAPGEPVPRPGPSGLSASVSQTSARARQQRRGALAQRQPPLRPASQEPQRGPRGLGGACRGVQWARTVAPPCLEACGQACSLGLLKGGLATRRQAPPCRDLPAQGVDHGAEEAPPLPPPWGRAKGRCWGRCGHEAPALPAGSSGARPRDSYRPARSPGNTAGPCLCDLWAARLQGCPSPAPGRPDSGQRASVPCETSKLRKEQLLPRGCASAALCGLCAVASQARWHEALGQEPLPDHLPCSSLGTEVPHKRSWVYPGSSALEGRGAPRPRSAGSQSLRVGSMAPRAGVLLGAAWETPQPPLLPCLQGRADERVGRRLSHRTFRVGAVAPLPSSPTVPRQLKSPKGKGPRGAKQGAFK